MNSCVPEKSRVAGLSLLAAVLLAVFKTVIGIMTGSLGILSEALHSALDFVAAGITWLCVRVSDKPADSDHNFGHEKIENLSALAEALLLLITCGWIVNEAIERLRTNETEISVGFWSFAVIITSIVVDISRSRALMKAAKKYKSQALEADALHFSTDILSSSVVLLGLICAYLGWLAADTIAALGVALIVAWISIGLAKRAINELLDKAPESIRNEVSKIISDASGVASSHDLRVRCSGAKYIIDVNIHVDKNLNIVDAHNISNCVEQQIRDRIGNAIINVHIEPDRHD